MDLQRLSDQALLRRVLRRLEGDRPWAPPPALTLPTLPGLRLGDAAARFLWILRRDGVQAAFRWEQAGEGLALAHLALHLERAHLDIPLAWSTAGEPVAVDLRDILRGLAPLLAEARRDAHA